MSRRLLRATSHSSYQQLLSNRARVSSVRCFSTSPKLSEAASSLSSPKLVDAVHLSRQSQWFRAIAAILSAGATYLAYKGWRPVVRETEIAIHETEICKIIADLRSFDHTPRYAHQISKDDKPVLFDLNPDVAELIKKHPVLVIEGSPGEGKTTQVMRSILESRPNHDEKQRPLILFAPLRQLKENMDLYSLFFAEMKSKWWFVENKDYGKLFDDVIKAAISRNIPVYVVVSDVQYFVDKASAQKQRFFSNLLQLSVDNQGNEQLKVVYTTNRLFSKHLLPFCGYDGCFETYQWKYKPNSIASGLKNCDKTLGKHADDLAKAFGNCIEDYITVDFRMSDQGDDDEYNALMKELKKWDRHSIWEALNEMHYLKLKPEGITLLNKLSEEGEVKYHWSLDKDILKVLQVKKVIHCGFDSITWDAQSVKNVYDEEFKSKLG